MASWAIWPGEVVNLDDPPGLVARGLKTVRYNGGFGCNNCFGASLTHVDLSLLPSQL